MSLVRRTTNTAWPRQTTFSICPASSLDASTSTGAPSALARALGCHDAKKGTAAKATPIAPVPTVAAVNKQRRLWSTSSFILFPREKRWPSGRRGIATRVGSLASRDPHFSMFAKVLWNGFLVYCMDVQFSTHRCSGPAPAGQGQARRLALRFGARSQHRVQLLQRTVGQSVRARAAVSVWI